jgi:hypothetical protein
MPRCGGAATVSRLPYGNRSRARNRVDSRLPQIPFDASKKFLRFNAAYLPGFVSK